MYDDFVVILNYHIYTRLQTAIFYDCSQSLYLGKFYYIQSMNMHKNNYCTLLDLFVFAKDVESWTYISALCFKPLR